MSVQVVRVTAAARPSGLSVQSLLVATKYIQGAARGGTLLSDSEAAKCSTWPGHLFSISAGRLRGGTAEVSAREHIFLSVSSCFLRYFLLLYS